MASRAYPRIGAQCKSEFGRSGALRTFPLRRRSGTARAADASARLVTASLSNRAHRDPFHQKVISLLVRFPEQQSAWSEPSHLQKEKIDVTHKQDCPCGSSFDNAYPCPKSAIRSN